MGTLFPIRIDDYIFDKWEHERKADVLCKVVGDFSGWDKDGTKYEAASQKLHPWKHLEEKRARKLEGLESFVMSKRVKWAEIEEELTELGKPALLRLLKELYDASAGNQAFFAARFLDQDATAEMREPYRQRIIHQFFPKRGFGKLDLRLARQAIRDYRRATSDIAGTVDLMLTYVENGTRFTNQYGDIEESFYNSMESVLGEAAQLLKSHPDVYLQFQDRLQGLVRTTSGVGWGYHDAVSETVGELEVQIGEAGE